MAAYCYFYLVFCYFSCFFLSYTICWYSWPKVCLIWLSFILFFIISSLRYSWFLRISWSSNCFYLSLVYFSYNFFSCACYRSDFVILLFRSLISLLLSLMSFSRAFTSLFRCWRRLSPISYGFSAPSYPAFYWANARLCIWYWLYPSWWRLYKFDSMFLLYWGS